MVAKRRTGQWRRPSAQVRSMLRGATGDTLSRSLPDLGTLARQREQQRFDAKQAEKKALIALGNAQAQVANTQKALADLGKNAPRPPALTYQSSVVGMPQTVATIHEVYPSVLSPESEHALEKYQQKLQGWQAQVDAQREKLEKALGVISQSTVSGGFTPEEVKKGYVVVGGQKYSLTDPKLAELRSGIGRKGGKQVGGGIKEKIKETQEARKASRFLREYDKARGATGFEDYIQIGGNKYTAKELRENGEAIIEKEMKAIEAEQRRIREEGDRVGRGEGAKLLTREELKAKEQELRQLVNSIKRPDETREPTTDTATRPIRGRAGIAGDTTVTPPPAPEFVVIDGNRYLVDDPKLAEIRGESKPDYIVIDGNRYKPDDPVAIAYQQANMTEREKIIAERRRKEAIDKGETPPEKEEFVVIDGNRYRADSPEAIAFKGEGRRPAGGRQLSAGEYNKTGLEDALSNIWFVTIDGSRYALNDPKLAEIVLQERAKSHVRDRAGGVPPKKEISIGDGSIPRLDVMVLNYIETEDGQLIVWPVGERHGGRPEDSPVADYPYSEVKTVCKIVQRPKPQPPSSGGAQPGKGAGGGGGDGADGGTESVEGATVSGGPSEAGEGEATGEGTYAEPSAPEGWEATDENATDLTDNNGNAIHVFETTDADGNPTIALSSAPDGFHFDTNTGHYVANSGYTDSSHPGMVNLNGTWRDVNSAMGRAYVDSVNAKEAIAKGQQARITMLGILSLLPTPLTGIPDVFKKAITARNPAVKEFVAQITHRPSHSDMVNTVKQWQQISDADVLVQKDVEAKYIEQGGTIPAILVGREARMDYITEHPIGTFTNLQDEGGNAIYGIDQGEGQPLKFSSTPAGFHYNTDLDLYVPNNAYIDHNQPDKVIVDGKAVDGDSPMARAWKSEMLIKGRIDQTDEDGNPIFQYTNPVTGLQALSGTPVGYEWDATRGRYVTKPVYMSQAGELIGFVMVGRGEWMPENEYDALPALLKDYIDGEGISGYMRQMKTYEGILGSFKSKDPETGEEYYDVSLIKGDVAQNPDVREAVAYMFPNYDINHLGRESVDKNTFDSTVRGLENSIQYAERWQDDLLYEGETAGQFRARLEDYKNSYFPIEGISPDEYNARKQQLVDAHEAPEVIDLKMSNYYMVTSDPKEYQEHMVKGGEQVEFKESWWQSMTPWKEQRGETASFGGVMVMLGETLLPGMYVARHWSELDAVGRGFNIVLDALSIIPFAKAAGMAARTIETTSRFGRVSAIGHALVGETIAQIKAPITLLVHPVGTVRGTYRGLKQMLQELVDQRHISEISISTAHTTQRYTAEQLGSLQTAMVIRDYLVELYKASEKPVITLLDETGKNGVRIELGVAPLFSTIGGGLGHVTPNVNIFLPVFKAEQSEVTRGILAKFTKTMEEAGAVKLTEKVKAGAKLTDTEQAILGRMNKSADEIRGLDLRQASTIEDEDAFNIWSESALGSQIDFVSGKFKVPVKEVTPDTMEKLSQVHEVMVLRQDFESAEEVASLARQVDVEFANGLEMRASMQQTRVSGKVVKEKEGMPEKEQGLFLTAGSLATRFGGESAHGGSKFPIMMREKGRVFKAVEKVKAKATTEITEGVEKLPLSEKWEERAKIVATKPFKPGQPLKEVGYTRHMEAVTHYLPGDITWLDKKPVKHVNFRDAKSVPADIADELQAYVKANNGRILGSFNEWLKLDNVPHPKDIDLGFADTAKAKRDIEKILNDAGYKTETSGITVQYYNKKGELVELGDLVDDAKYQDWEYAEFIRPDNMVDEFRVPTLGEQYLRQISGAKDLANPKHLKRVDKVKRASKDIRNLLEGAGAERAQPGAMVFSKEFSLNAVSSEKPYKTFHLNSMIDDIIENYKAKAGVEVENKFPANIELPSADPKATIKTTIGLGDGMCDFHILLEKPLTKAQIQKISKTGLVEWFKTPFKRPLSITKIGKGLTGEEIEQLQKWSTLQEALNNLHTQVGKQGGKVTIEQIKQMQQMIDDTQAYIGNPADWAQRGMAKGGLSTNILYRKLDAVQRLNLDRLQRQTIVGIQKNWDTMRSMVDDAIAGVGSKVDMARRGVTPEMLQENLEQIRKNWADMRKMVDDAVTDMSNKAEMLRKSVADDLVRQNLDALQQRLEQIKQNWARTQKAVDDSMTDVGKPVGKAKGGVTQKQLQDSLEQIQKEFQEQYGKQIDDVWVSLKEEADNSARAVSDADVEKVFEDNMRNWESLKKVVDDAKADIGSPADMARRGITDDILKENIEKLQKVVDDAKTEINREAGGLNTGLGERELNQLADVLRDSGNRIAAKDLRDAIVNDVRIRNALAGIRVGGDELISLNRFDVRTGERIGRIPERVLGRVEALRRAEEARRAPREERTPRTGRVPRTERPPRAERPPRVQRPPRIERPPRSVRVPRIPRITRVTTPPRTTKPPRIIIKGTGRALTPNELESSVAWKQGIMYKLVYPPYQQENIINSRHPFPGMRIHTGPRSAYETLIRTQRGRLPSTIVRDMGMMRIAIKGATRTTGEPKMVFQEVEKRKGSKKRHSGRKETLTKV